MENGENEKIRKNGAARNTNEQCFGQLHGMAMAFRGWAALKTLMGFNVSYIRTTAMILEGF